MKKRRRKVPTTQHAGFSIREVRPGYFMADIVHENRRERKCFKTLDEAKVFAEVERRRIQNEGTSAFALTPEHRIDALKALELLKGRETLRAAVEHWLLYHPETGGLTLSELGDRYIDAIARAGCRETTIAARRYMVNRLCQAHGDTPCPAITANMLNKFFDDLRLKEQNRDTHRRCYHAMFQYAMREKLLPHNPAAELEKIRADEKLPTPFTVKQTAAIMATAERIAPAIVPTLAAQFFGGLRPGEALGLTWPQVNFTEKFIRVMPETSKVRAARIVELNDTLAAWLLPYRRPSGPVGIETKSQFAYYLHKKGLIEKSGVRWLRNGARKTFATMFFATHQDAGKTAAIMGHRGGVDVLYRHYRGLATAAEAAAYWNIRPKVKEQKVIQFKTA